MSDFDDAGAAQESINNQAEYEMQASMNNLTKLKRRAREWLDSPYNRNLIPTGDELITELLASLEADGWQPIETAPRDGTWVLLAGGKTDEDFYPREYKNESSRTVTAKWLNDYEDDDETGYWVVGFWDGGWRNAYDNPTRWQPLPSAPEGL